MLVVIFIIFRFVVNKCLNTLVFIQLKEIEWEDAFIEREFWNIEWD